MSNSVAASAVERALAGLLVAAAWACYLPLGVQYATVLSAAMAAGLLLHRRAREGAPMPLATRWSALTATLALLAWLALTGTWSPAPLETKSAHLAHYGVLLIAPLLATASPPVAAQRALRHFVVASTLVAAVFVIDRLGALPASSFAWHTTVNAQGNQRIATSILLAVGSCLALWLGLQGRPSQRWAWRACAAICLVGLAWQDRRTGMVVLPAVLLAWVLAAQPTWQRRLVMSIVVMVAAGASWAAFDGVRARFTEGLSELQHYRASDDDTTSWGQRMRLWQVTAEMIEERPLQGHGLASWLGQWRNRVKPGSAVFAHTTPHSTYLLLAQQGGVIALLLWLWVLGAWIRPALRAGSVGIPALMVWTALACAGLFNALLRDAKFALPLLLLAAMATALLPAQKTPTDPSTKA